MIGSVPLYASYGVEEIYAPPSFLERLKTFFHIDDTDD
jgi:hypothetical protein